MNRIIFIVFTVLFNSIILCSSEIKAYTAPFFPPVKLQPSVNVRMPPYSEVYGIRLYGDEEIPLQETGMTVNDSLEIKISFAGDCTLGTDPAFAYSRSFPGRLELENNNYSYFFKNVADIFENDDLTIVNLETTLTSAMKPANKKFRFKGLPAYTNILKAGYIEMVNISNNHTHDYLEQGFNDTLHNLQNAGILYSGEGHTAYYKVKGKTIASIGFTGWTTSIKESIGTCIGEARRKADIVIVSFHWGEERKYIPNRTQIELGRYCIDHGADIVAGHHPHVIQGIEYYKQKYIVYSLGNFSFGGNSNPSDKDSFIFQPVFTFTSGRLDGCKAEIIPCLISSEKNINNYQPTILEGSEKEKVLKRIYDYSSGLQYGIGKGTSQN